METKYGKLISRTRSGELTEVYPEIRCDAELDWAERSSKHPVSNYVVANALESAFSNETGGLKWNEIEKKGYVDFSSFSAQQLLVLCLEGGGIVPDPETGKLKIDFSTIDEATKRNIISSLKMQIPLAESKTIYVDNVNGDNTYADEDGFVIAGKGETSSLAFKTIQGAVSFVTEHWALGSKSVNILLISNNEPYSEYVTLPAFNRTTGNIHIKSADASRRARIINPTASGRIFNCIGGSYSLQNLDIEAEYYRANDGGNHYPGLVGAGSYGSITLYGCHCKCSYGAGYAADQKWFSLRLFASSDYGCISFGLINGSHNTIEYHKNNASDCIVLQCQSNGKIQFHSSSIDETISVQLEVEDEASFNTLLQNESYSTLATSESQIEGHVVVSGKISLIRSFLNAAGYGTNWKEYLYEDSLYMLKCFGECTVFCSIASGSLVRYAGGANYNQFFFIPEGKTATGKRHSCASLSCIDMAGMAGSFPGDIEGTADSTAFAYANTAVDGIIGGIDPDAITVDKEVFYSSEEPTNDNTMSIQNESIIFYENE